MTVQTDYGPNGVEPVRLVCGSSCDYARQCSSCRAMEAAVRRCESRQRRAAILDALGLRVRHESVMARDD